ncbi:unnamed protein product [Mesocestoides corti]|uniref:DUF5734 domain-containing protein n=1 Tax=Mesocestoides corti TaxID=53468 RepID=A0A0R3UBT1_MESCO|nr:unnamed protein product [Mesocestoides corti]
MTQPEFLCQLEYVGLSSCAEKRIQRGINKSFRKSLKAQPRPTVLAVYNDRFTFSYKKTYLRFHDIRKICASEFHKTVVACTSIDDDVKIITMRFAKDRDYRRTVLRLIGLVRKNIEPIFSRIDTTEVHTTDMQSISLSPITASGEEPYPTMEPTRRSAIYEVYNRAGIETSRRQSRSEVGRSNRLLSSAIITPPQSPIFAENTPRQAARPTAITPPQPPTPVVVIPKQTSDSTSTTSSASADSTEAIETRASRPVRQKLITPSRSTKATQKQTSGYPVATQTRKSRSMPPTPIPTSRHTVSTQKHPSGYPAATQTLKPRPKQPTPMPSSRHAVARSDQPPASIGSASRHSSSSPTPMHSTNSIVTQQRHLIHPAVLTPRWQHRSRAPMQTPSRSSSPSPPTPYVSVRRTSVGYIRTRSLSPDGLDADLVTSFVKFEEHWRPRCVKGMPPATGESPIVLEAFYEVKGRPRKAAVDAVKPRPKRRQPRKRVTSNKEGIYRYLSQYDSDTDASSVSDTSEDKPSPLSPAVLTQKKDSEVSKNTAPDPSKPLSPALVEPPRVPTPSGQGNANVVEIPTS